MKLHVLEKAFIDLLRDNLSISNSKIFAGSRYIPLDLTPCVTVVCADESFRKRDYIEYENIQYIRRRYDANVWINIWCNTEEERTQLIDEINLRLNQAEANHYTTCANYNKGTCMGIMDTCKTLTIDNGRTNKLQCPLTEYYKSFFKTNNIIKRTFHTESTLDLDELDSSEPLLRTIFRLQMTYYNYYRIGGKLYEKLTFSEELI